MVGCEEMGFRNSFFVDSLMKVRAFSRMKYIVGVFGREAQGGGTIFLGPITELKS